MPLCRHIATLLFLASVFSSVQVVFCGSEPTLRKAIKKGDVQQVRMLLEKGMDPNGRSKAECPLAKATRDNLVEIVELLLEAGADPDGRTLNGGSPLLLASGKCYSEISARLIKAGADINRQFPSTGGSPLYYAARENCIAVLEQLLTAGAGLNVRTKRETYDRNNNLIPSGSTPWMVANSLGNTAVVRLLEEEDHAREKAGTVKTYVARSKPVEGRISFRQSCPSGAKSFLWAGTGKEFEVDVEAKGREELLDAKLFQDLLNEVLQALAERCEDSALLRAIRVFISYGMERKVVAEALYQTTLMSEKGSWIWMNHLLGEYINTQFKDIHGVELFLASGDEIVANPFLHEGKVVAFPAIFRAMETSDTARFSTPAGDFFLTGVDLDQFTQPNEFFYIAGRVSGKKNVEGLGRLTTLEIVTANACIQANCREILQ